MKHKIVLQLFADGGAGASAAGSEGAGTGVAANVAGDSPVSQQGGDLQNVVYGKSNPDLTQPEGADKSTMSPEDKQKYFENMIKKGGEYHDQFSKYFQAEFNRRHKESKGLEEQLKSYDPIMQTLSAKYGVDASDIKGLTKALENDNSLFEEAAFKEGLSPEQYRQKLTLERENAELKAAVEKREAEERSNQIYKQWQDDALALGQKYGREIDLAAECENPEFTNLLANGVQFEAAYNAIHIDEMLNGAMAATAANVEQALVNKVTSRAQRPSENGIESSSTKVFKADVDKFTDADMKEIRRRVEAGAKIAL